MKYLKQLQAPKGEADEMAKAADKKADIRISTSKKNDPKKNRGNTRSGRWTR